MPALTDAPIRPASANQPSIPVRSRDSRDTREFVSCGEAAAECCGGLRVLERGEVLFERGQQDTQMYTCTRGLLKSRKFDHLGREVITQLIEPGTRFGAEALLGLPYGTTVEALEPSEVCGIRVGASDTATFQDPELLRNIAVSLAFQVMKLEDSLRDFGLKPARARAAAALLARARNGRTDSQGHPVVTPDITRQDLAALAGMTPETFIRILSVFRAKALVRAEGRRLTLLDPKRLASLAGETNERATDTPVPSMAH